MQVSTKTHPIQAPTAHQTHQTYQTHQTLQTQTTMARTLPWLHPTYHPTGPSFADVVRNGSSAFLNVFGDDDDLTNPLVDDVAGVDGDEGVDEQLDPEDYPATGPVPPPAPTPQRPLVCISHTNFFVWESLTNLLDPLDALKPNCLR